MPVIKRNQWWPNSRVPYTFKEGPYGAFTLQEVEAIKGYIGEINKAVGYELLEPRLDSDPNYIEVVKAQNGSGFSQEKGYVGKGKQMVYVPNVKDVVQHEILHALGFYHEQQHRDYPWSHEFLKTAPRVEELRIMGLTETAPTVEELRGMGLTEEGRSRTKEGRSRTKKGRSRTKEVYIGDDNIRLFKRVQRLGVGSNFICCNILDWITAQRDQSAMSWGLCDPDSVMMYKEMGQAVIGMPNMYPSGHATDAPCLSNRDVEALRFMYPSHNRLLTPKRWDVDDSVWVPGTGNLPYERLLKGQLAFTGQSEVDFRSQFVKAVRSTGLRRIRVFLMGPRGQVKNSPWVNWVASEATQFNKSVDGFSLGLLKTFFDHGQPHARLYAV
jgi:hypothetical protein